MSLPHPWCYHCQHKSKRRNWGQREEIGREEGNDKCLNVYSHIFLLWGVSFTNEFGCHAQDSTVILQCTLLISDVENLTWDHNLSFRGGLSSPRRLLLHEQAWGKLLLSFHSGDYTIVPLIQRLLLVEFVEYVLKGGRWLTEECQDNISMHGIISPRTVETVLNFLLPSS